MTKPRTPLFIGFLAVVALAAGLFLYLQEQPGAEARDADLAAGSDEVPEAATVHEGAREAIPLDHAGPISITVYASPTCGCCSEWVKHVEEHGFEAEVIHRSDILAVKEELGVPSELQSCHTAVVNDYLVEGHVPAEDLRRFLAEAPEARGLTVPGMPVGSPGMEMPSGEVDPYQVLVFRSDGSTSVYAEHGPGETAAGTD